MKPERYDIVRHHLWVVLLGRLIHTDGPCGCFRIQSRRVGWHWPVGCYTATHDDNTVRYVGNVHRPGNAFDKRFANHHQPVGDWGRVWLLPLRTDVSAFVVGAVEAPLNTAQRPTGNRVRPRFWPLANEEAALVPRRREAGCR